jgi:hypothetical protein
MRLWFLGGRAQDRLLCFHLWWPGSRADSQRFVNAELQGQCSNGSAKYGAICNRDELVENLRQHCIPIGIFDSLANDYESFLAERRKLMSTRMQDYFAKL